MRRQILFGMTALLAAMGAPSLRADADEDWQKVLALDAGPREQLHSAADAKRVALQFLATQERAYRGFLRTWPADPHALDARLRLAQLLAVKADFTSDAGNRDEAVKMLAALATSPATPVDRQSDVQFARITVAMRAFKSGSGAARSDLLGRVQAFQKSWPQDRRIAPLLVEVASLYDEAPTQMRMLLEQARALTSNVPLQARIADDLQRLSLLGSPVHLQFRSLQGEDVDVAKLAGKIVVIVFFATWSQPSLETLDALPTWPSSQVAVLGVSLDKDSAALKLALAAVKFTAPVACDEKGWQSPLVRTFGINAVPTVWILDRQGRLRALNASNAPDSMVQTLSREH